MQIILHHVSLSLFLSLLNLLMKTAPKIFMVPNVIIIPSKANEVKYRSFLILLDFTNHAQGFMSQFHSSKKHFLSLSSRVTFHSCPILPFHLFTFFSLLLFLVFSTSFCITSDSLSRSLLAN